MVSPWCHIPTLTVPPCPLPSRTAQHLCHCMGVMDKEGTACPGVHSRHRSLPSLFYTGTLCLAPHSSPHSHVLAVGAPFMPPGAAMYFPCQCVVSMFAPFSPWARLVDARSSDTHGTGDTSGINVMWELDAYGCPFHWLSVFPSLRASVSSSAAAEDARAVVHKPVGF